MTKTLKRLFAVVLTIAVTISFSTLAFAENAPLYAEEEFEIVFVEDLLADPEFSDYIINYLHSRWGEQFFINQTIASATADLIFDSFPVSRTGEVMYPVSFGGMYIDSDGNLVLLIVEDVILVREWPVISEMTATAHSGGASVRTVEFSYAELREAWLSIHYFLVENWGSGCVVVSNVYSAGVDIVNNRISVELRDIDLQQTELFRETIMNHPALVFLQADEKPDANMCIYTIYYAEASNVDPDAHMQPLNTTTVHPGNAIRRGSASGAIRSVGYRVRRATGQRGFVTAMHGTQANDSFFLNGTNVGQITISSRATDSVFVQLPASGVDVSMRNPVAAPNTTVSPNVHARPLVGQSVMRISEGGRLASGNQNHPLVASGLIDVAERSREVLGLGFVYVFRAEFEVIAGDSGGIVVRHDGSNWLITGIVIARADTVRAYFAHSVRINNALDVHMQW